MSQNFQFKSFSKTFAKLPQVFIATFDVLKGNEDSMTVAKPTKRQKQKKYRATRNREPQEKD